MQIWDNLKFEDLGETNIQAKNFFQFLNETSKSGFDLVIGNPPFNSPIDKNKNAEYLQFIKTKYQIEPSYKIADDNLAIFFLDKCIELAKPQKHTCLIIPSNVWLFNQNSTNYRSYFFGKYQVEQIIDFTYLKGKLFHANVTACSVIASNQTPAKSNVLHLTIKRNKVAEERAFFEIDHYDFHQINYQLAIENEFVWKANLLVGTRLLRIINYLSSLPKLVDYINRQSNWVYNEGYIIGNKKNIAPYITNKKYIPTGSFKSDGSLNYNDIGLEREKGFEGPRSEALFTLPLLLIKENAALPTHFVSEQKLLEISKKKKLPIESQICFKDKIVGIHSPVEGKSVLIKISERLNTFKKLYQFYTRSTSYQSFQRAGTIIKADIDNLPYPEDEIDL